MTKEFFATQDDAALAGEAFCLADMANFGQACTDTAEVEPGKWVAVIKLPNEDFDRILRADGTAS